MFAHYEESYSYSPELLLRTWSDPAFLRYKYARLHQAPLLIEVSKPGDSPIAILSLYRAHVAPSGVLRLLAPIRAHVQQYDRWSVSGSTAQGTWRLRSDDLPVMMSGSMSLKTPTPTKTQFSVTAQIVATGTWSWPAGELLARVAARTLPATLARSAVITADWLALRGEVALSHRPRLAPRQTIEMAQAE